MPGFNDYLVHQSGDIYSLKRGSITSLRVRERKDGYCTVALYGDGHRFDLYVHFIVAAAFLGPRPTGFYIDHVDMVKSNNAAWNLEYVTKSESAKRITRRPARKAKNRVRGIRNS